MDQIFVLNFLRIGGLWLAINISLLAELTDILSCSPLARLGPCLKGGR